MEAPRGMPLLSGPPPPPSDSGRAEIACRKCNKEFNIIFTRARRCNHCGYSYCHSCTDFQALMPRAVRAGANAGYDVVPVCAFCADVLSITATPRAALRRAPLAKLKAYATAYGLRDAQRALEKDELVDAIVAARGQNGCLPLENERFYRQHAVPRHAAGARPRGLFAPRGGSAPPPARPPRAPRPEFARPDLGEGAGGWGGEGRGVGGRGVGLGEGESFSRSTPGGPSQEAPGGPSFADGWAEARREAAQGRAGGTAQGRAGGTAQGRPPQPPPPQSRPGGAAARPGGGGAEAGTPRPAPNTSTRPSPNSSTRPAPAPPAPPRPPSPPNSSTRPAPAPQAPPRPPSPPPLDALLDLDARGALPALGVGVLKAILRAQHVPLGQVLEKGELVGRVRALVAEERRVRAERERWEGGEGGEGEGEGEGEGVGDGEHGGAGAAHEARGLAGERGSPKPPSPTPGEQPPGPRATEGAPGPRATEGAPGPRAPGQAPSPPTSSPGPTTANPKPKPAAASASFADRPAPSSFADRPAPSSFADRPGLCVVCQDEDAVLAIVDCGHLALCAACAARIMRSTRECPLCRTRIVTEGRLLRIFRA
ncbi:hypothetical protein HDZ31DRAFT_61788 [Schizophyllum fasciatum]